MTFDDLQFDPHPGGSGIRATVRFPNHYSASVICGPYSYGGTNGLYELAVLHKGLPCYDTPITDDVRGWLSPADVTAILQQIEALEPRT